jgi:hypothetical protein
VIYELILTEKEFCQDLQIINEVCDIKQRFMFDQCNSFNVVIHTNFI